MELDVVVASPKGLVLQTLVLLADSILFLTKAASKSTQPVFTGIVPLKSLRLQALPPMQVKLYLKTSLAKAANIDISKASPYWLQMIYHDQEFLFSTATEKDQTTLLSAFDSTKLTIQSRFWRKVDCPQMPEPRSNNTYVHPSSKILR